MRSLKKLPEPEVVTANQKVWTEKYLEAKTTGQKLPSAWSHPKIRETLQAETDSRCAYCDSHLAHVASSHIEHYRPRSLYPELVVAWENLTVACPRCNSSKSDLFSEDLPFINPFLDEPDEHFVFFGELVLAPSSQRGEYTISELGLNNDDLMSARKRRLNNIVQLVSSWHKAHDLLKPGILDEIRRQLDQGEYQASVKSLLKTLNFKV
ncbi:HNH endonuclease [Arthrobacter sp. M4]|uniref:HNH endonuclease n=1 Tax=Arthrobacter sp. M4 TaxID=218160 RepID=UPI001CDD8721|nr:HNH endonuclease [Arthrobacter sp. M4]MCA4132648.1 HNH endonuclease [Arthrobacter sp. M4]